jgi:hypothetical protein
MKMKLAWLALVGLAAASGQQWIGGITDGTRPPNVGVERTGNSVKVWCEQHERTFPFTTWPPFTVAGEHITSSKMNNGKLFSCMIGFDGTDMKADCKVGDDAQTLQECLTSTVIP